MGNSCDGNGGCQCYQAMCTGIACPVAAIASATLVMVTPGIVGVRVVHACHVSGSLPAVVHLHTVRSLDIGVHCRGCERDSQWR